MLISLIFFIFPARAQTPGSWSTVLDGFALAVPGRVYESAHLVPMDVDALEGNKTSRIYWQYQVPAGRSVAAWLCRSMRCVALGQQRGWVNVFSGLKPNEPLYFKFSLREGDLQPLIIEKMQVIVNYH